MKNFIRKQQAERNSKPGFTLVEMLVVISIITILMTVGAMGLRNLSKASGVSAGIPIAEALFAEARAIAQGKGTNARVLVHATNNPGDDLHRERFLRYMVVQYLDPATNSWVIGSRGVKLPDGVFFDLALSEAGGLALPTETNVSLPGNSSTTCYSYEFNAEGNITNPAPNGNSVPRFVIRAGNLNPGDNAPKATGDNKRNIGGFVIWKSGRTSVFRHPDQIENNNP